MADITETEATQQLTTAVENAPVATQMAIMGADYTPDMKRLVTLADVAKVGDKLKLDDWQNLIEPLLVNKIFKTEISNFVANNPFDRFFRENSPFGAQKEHIVALYATIVNLTGESDSDMANIIKQANYKGADVDPSTLDFMESKDLVYYTNHIRSFVATASLNQTEIKRAFTNINTFNDYFNRKVDVLMEHAKNEEFATTAKKLASLMLPQSVGLIADDTELALEFKPKITLLGEDTKQADLVQTLQTYVNNIKFPALAREENPLGLPLITKPEDIIAYVTPNIMASQNFLEAYAFTSNKVTLPQTTEMMAPLPPVELTAAEVQTLGTVAGVTDGKFTGKVLPIAVICDENVLEINHSQFYTDVEQNKLKEFISPQVHDHFSVHPSYEKNIRFFAIPITDEAGV